MTPKSWPFNVGQGFPVSSAARLQEAA